MFCNSWMQLSQLQYIFRDIITRSDSCAQFVAQFLFVDTLCVPHAFICFTKASFSAMQMKTSQAWKKRPEIFFSMSRDQQALSLAVGRVGKSKNRINSYDYCFLVAFWYVETRNNIFFGKRKFYTLTLQYT